ncbi:MAG: lysoplasmalogenase [Pseudomonadota bacterium]
MITYLPSLFCLLFAGMLVRAEFVGSRAGSWAFKPAAAAMFVVQAVISGAVESGYGLLILTGLVLSAAGDVLLIPRERQVLFKLGMASFGLAHVVYAAAFFGLGFAGGGWPAPQLWLSSTFAAAFALVFVWRWLGPHLQSDERPLVLIYMALILAMFVGSWVKSSLDGNGWVVLAALMFAASDLFVAKDRFVKREPENALVITPLYFGAQLIFALTIV